MTGVADLLRRAAAKSPDTLAIRVDEGASMTYAELHARSSRWAGELRTRGAARGDRIALAIPNALGDVYLTAYFAAQKLGCVITPLNLRAPVASQRQQIDHAEAKIVIDEDTAIAIETASARLPDDDPDVAIADDDLAEIMYTSGTTGEPKGVRVTHGSLLAFKSPLAAMFADKTFLHPLPLHTFAGMTFMLMCVRTRMTNLLMQRFDPARFAELLASQNVAWTYAVSSMWLLVLKEATLASEHPALRLVQLGASPMPPSAVIDLCDAFPNAIVMNLYGLTEAGGAGCVMPPGQARNRPDAVGQPLPHTEISIVNDDGEPLPEGESGEIWMRRKNGKARAYHRDESATQEAWTDDGWLRTGDIGFVDADGYLHIVDRKKDIIIRGGHNIASLEVENALYQHPAIAQAAVVGVPHDVLGEDIVAFIKVQGDVSDETLAAFLRERLADYKVPRRYDRVTELPRNAMGKVLKRELRKRS